MIGYNFSILLNLTEIEAMAKNGKFVDEEEKLLVTDVNGRLVLALCDVMKLYQKVFNKTSGTFLSISSPILLRTEYKFVFLLCEVNY